MASEKTTAIVLRVVEFSETSCVVTMMTRDFGKITALAKGARRKKSPFEAALDVLAICRIVFLHKTSQALDLLTEAKLEKRFRSSATDLSRFYAGLYVVELLSAMTEQSDPHPELFDLAEHTLNRLDSDGNVASLLLRFEFGILTILGQKPMLDQCVGCGREKTSTESRVSFGLNEGGVLCQSCRRGKMNVVSLSGIAWNTMVQYSKTENEGSCVDTQLGIGENEAGSEVRRVMNQYFAHLMGYRPKLQEYITL